MAITFVALVSGGLWLFATQHDRFLEEGVERMAGLAFMDFDHATEAARRGLMKTAHILVSDPGTAEDLESRDSRNLERRWGPVLLRMLHEGLLTHAHFLDAQGAVWMRLQEPQKIGDLSGSFCAMEALRLGRAFSGFERDMEGNVVFWLAYPLRRHELRVGGVELGISVQQLLSLDAQLAGVMMVAAVSANEEGRSASDPSLGSENLRLVTGSGVAVATLGAPPSELLAFLKPLLSSEPGRNKGRQLIQFEGRRWGAECRPLVSAAGGGVGKVRMPG